MATERSFGKLLQRQQQLTFEYALGIMAVILKNDERESTR